MRFPVPPENASPIPGRSLAKAACYVKTGAGLKLAGAVCGGCLAAVTPASAGEGSDTAGDSEPSYLEMVVEYADTMMEHGRDRWGETSSPLFASMLDRDSHDLMGYAVFERISHPNTGVSMMMLKEDARKPHGFGYSSADRMPDSANVGHDEHLYSTLYRLAEVTGETKYAEAADAALRYFWTNLQDSNTGLMAWGEHLGWHLPGDTWMTTHPLSHARVHELWQRWPHFDRSYALGEDVAAAVDRFALGEWNHVVRDQENALFSRHTYLDSYPNTGRSGSEYPRLIGQMCAHWARAYANSEDEAFREEMLRAINSILTHSLRRRTEDGAVRAGTSERDRQWVWVFQNLWTVLQLHETVLPQVEGELRAKVEEMIESQRAVILDKLDHPLNPEHVYMRTASAETLEPGHHSGEKSGYTTLWKSTGAFARDLIKYGRRADDPEMLELGLAGARLYLSPGLPALPEGKYRPGEMAHVIELMLWAREVTGDGRYLERAELFAGKARELFFDERSPLPTIIALNDYGKSKRAYQAYETVGGADDLMFALLNLHIVRERVRGSG